MSSEAVAKARAAIVLGCDLVAAPIVEHLIAELYDATMRAEKAAAALAKARGLVELMANGGWDIPKATAILNDIAAVTDEGS